MSDDPNASSTAAGEQPNPAPPLAPPPATGNTPAPNGNALAGLLDGESGDAGGGDNAAGEAAGEAANDDWRAAYAGGDEQVLRELKRYARPQNVAKALVDAKARIRAGLTPPELPEDATPEQIAEYRDIMGVPETPDGYGIQFSPELSKALGLGEQEQAQAKGFAEYMHAKHVPASATKAAFDYYQEVLAREAQQQRDARQRAVASTDTELAREYGPEYSRNLGILKEWMEQNPAMARAVNAFGYDKGFMQEAIQIALELADPDAFYDSAPGGSGKTAEERIDELATIGVTSKRTPAQEREYDALLSARIKREQRGPRGRAA